METFDKSASVQTTNKINLIILKAMNKYSMEI